MKLYPWKQCTKAEVERLEALFQQSVGCHHSWVARAMEATALKAEVERLKSEMQREREVRGEDTCAYCLTPLGPPSGIEEGAERYRAHALACAKHPAFGLAAEVERLREEAAALREALEAAHVDGGCPACDNGPNGCPALAHDAGAALLERLRMAEEAAADHGQRRVELEEYADRLLAACQSLHRAWCSARRFHADEYRNRIALEDERDALERVEARSQEHARSAEVLRGKWAEAMAEVERLKASMVEHFTRDHLAGDGPEIDRWRARVAELEGAGIAVAYDSQDEAGDIRALMDLESVLLKSADVRARLHRDAPTHMSPGPRAELLRLAGHGGDAKDEVERLKAAVCAECGCGPECRAMGARLDELPCRCTSGSTLPCPRHATPTKGGG